jgi:hypothetical protein
MQVKQMSHLSSQAGEADGRGGRARRAGDYLTETQKIRLVLFLQGFVLIHYFNNLLLFIWHFLHLKFYCKSFLIHPVK